MPRTKGAKNKPKDPARELERVQKLFADQGLDFPAADKAADIASAAVEKDVTKSEVAAAGDTLSIQTVEKGSEREFECGGCGSELDRAHDVCPICGNALTWSA